MYSSEIDSILTDDEICAPFYEGAMGRDEFLNEASDFGSSRRTPRIFVVNTQNSTQTGDHWLGVVLAADESILFDSFGFPPRLYNDIAYAASRHAPLTTTSITLQDVGSDVCGDYCVAFCLAASRSVPLDAFVDYWESKDDRDATVRRMVDGYLHRSLSR